MYHSSGTRCGTANRGICSWCGACRFGIPRIVLICGRATTTAEECEPYGRRQQSHPCGLSESSPNPMLANHLAGRLFAELAGSEPVDSPGGQATARPEGQN